jgi:hypothetical protein
MLTPSLVFFAGTVEYTCTEFTRVTAWDVEQNLARQIMATISEVPNLILIGIFWQLFISMQI